VFPIVVLPAVRDRKNPLSRLLLRVGCYICVLLAVLAGCPPTTGQANRGSVDWVLVLDTSASMHGAGGTANIFGKVKEAISDFIRSAREGDTVTVYTFDRDTTLRGHVRVTGEIDKKDLLKVVEDVPSEGDRTYTGKAIHDALERAIDLRQRSDATNRTVSIVLFTDGLEDVRGLANPISISSNIDLVPKAQPYIFFVSVGVQAHETQLESFVKNAAMENRGEVIRDPGASGIAEVGERIRKIVEAPPAPPAPIQLTVSPSTLSFGQLEAGEKGEQVIHVKSNAACSLRVALTSSDNNLSLSEPKDVVPLNSGEDHVLPIQLSAADGARDGVLTIALSLTAEPSDATSIGAVVNVPVTVNVFRTPLWQRVLKYLLLMLVLIAIVLAIISVVKGEPPWIWLPAITERVSLQGELQIIHPRPPRVEDEFISLNQLNARRVCLGSLIPDGAVDGSDAELAVTKHNGELRINLLRTKGSVYVNKIEVANSRIYNDDVIELGGSKLLFSWVNHDRPSVSEETQEV
jgi:von Willebrand factor type A domain